MKGMTELNGFYTIDGVGQVTAALGHSLLRFGFGTGGGGGGGGGGGEAYLELMDAPPPLEAGGGPPQLKTRRARFKTLAYASTARCRRNAANLLVSAAVRRLEGLFGLPCQHATNE